MQRWHCEETTGAMERFEVGKLPTERRQEKYTAHVSPCSADLKHVRPTRHSQNQSDAPPNAMWQRPFSLRSGPVLVDFCRDNPSPHQRIVFAHFYRGSRN
jgi:hypothetical protein